MSELPRYRCHKEVEALKIKAIVPAHSGDGAAVLVFADQPAEVVPFKVSAAYVAKHKPAPGGYWVRYGDGYESFSPAAAFEEGYTRIS